MIDNRIKSAHSDQRLDFEALDVDGVHQNSPPNDAKAVGRKRKAKKNKKTKKRELRTCFSPSELCICD